MASALLDRGDHAEAARLLADAEAAAERVPAERLRRFDVSFSALQLHVARLRGDLEAALETGRELSRRGELEAGVVDADLRALALVNLGIAELWTGELDGAEHHLERARGAAAEAGHDWVVLIAVAHLAVLAGTRHDYPRVREAGARGDRARRAARLAAHLAGGRGVPRPRRRAVPLGSHATRPRRRSSYAREALAGTQERPLRAGPRAAALRRARRPRRARGRARGDRGGRRGAGRLPAAAGRSATTSRSARRCCAPSSATASRRRA